MKRLFIGGIQNGKMIDVEPYMDRIIIPVWKNQDSITPGTMGSAETKEEHYLRVDIHTHSEAFHLFIEKDLSIRDAFQMLIDKYADK